MDKVWIFYICAEFLLAIHFVQDIQIFSHRVFWIFGVILGGVVV